MIVIACGMRRSASTLQYHIAREIVWYHEGHDAGFMADGARGFEKVARKHAFDLSVCKVHMYLPEHSQLAASLLASGQARAVYIYRNPLDVAASMKRFRPNSYGRKGWIDISQVHEKWLSQKNVYVSRYDDVVNDIETEALNIAKFLDLDLPKTVAGVIARKLHIKNQRLRMPNHGLNRKEWLWDNHIFTGHNGLWQDELTSAEIATVRRYMSDIIEEYENN